MNVLQNKDTNHRHEKLFILIKSDVKINEIINESGSIDNCLFTKI